MSLDPLGAFVRKVSRQPPADDCGRLAGLTFAVKDNIDIQGVPTGNGSLHYAEWRGVPARDATVVTLLEAAGAKCIAKTHMHELAYGLTGLNEALGTPKNPFRPGRIPGGSSSGSAVATAARLVDFAVGTDTGGSIRVPAAFCGVYGFRPTTGAIPLDGVVSLAESFDTVGLFARTAELLERVALTLLPEEVSANNAAPTTIVVFKDIDTYADDVSRMMVSELTTVLKRLGYRLEEAQGKELLAKARAAQLVLQGAEALEFHRAWIDTAAPKLGADVAGLLRTASMRSTADVQAATRLRNEASNELAHSLAGGKVLLLPATPGDPPTLEELSDPDLALEFRTSVLNLSNLASVAGVPVVSIPTPGPGGEGLGVQAIAAVRNDGLALRLARQLEEVAL